MEFLAQTSLKEGRNGVKNDEDAQSPLKVLMTVPDLEDPGGVANYYNQIRPYWNDEVNYFFVGKRARETAKLDKLKRIFLDYLRFWKSMSARDYDLVQVNPSLGKAAVPRDAMYILLAKMRRKKVIVFIRGWNEEYERTINGNRILKCFFKVIYGKADAILVLGECFKERLVRWGFKNRILRETTVVDNGVFENVVVRTDSAPFRLLFLARMQKEKGVYIILDTLAELEKRGFQVAATMAGDGDELDNAVAYAKQLELSNVYFPGYVSGEDKANSFIESDIFFFPTFHGEGMPNCVLEAMAYGLPVVVRPQGGVQDFFEDGKMGFSTTSKDPLVFADMIEKLVTTPNLINEISTYNRNYAERWFRASAVETRIRGIWRQIHSE